MHPVTDRVSVVGRESAGGTVHPPGPRTQRPRAVHRAGPEESRSKEASACNLH
jgi:hypothetical protein